MPTLGRIRATRQDDCPTRCGPHPDHGNGLAGEPRLGPSGAYRRARRQACGVASGTWRCAAAAGGHAAAHRKNHSNHKGFVPHPSRFVPPSPASQTFGRAHRACGRVAGVRSPTLLEVTTTMRLWLIDSGYLFNARHSVRPNYQFDYLKLRQRLEQDGDFWRAYYLNSTPHPPTDAQDAFHTWLRSAGPRGPKLITKLYELKKVRADRAFCDQCGAKVTLSCPGGDGHRLANQQQKGVDVGLATLALTHRDRYDALVLSSGDSDLLDAVEFLSEQGKRIELAVFTEDVSTDLQARADQIYWINEFEQEVSRT